MSTGGDMTIDDYLDALLDGTPAAPDGVGAAMSESAPVAVVAAPPALPPAPDVIEDPRPAVRPAPPAPAPAVSQPRAAAMAAPPMMPPPSMSQRWLRANVGNDSYALELLRVQEVLRPAPIVAMRGAAPAVLGVMNLRGRVVPVFDLGIWLGTERVQPDERSRIVVVERNDELIGALVTAVEDVVTLGRDRVEPPLPGSDPGAIVGIARVGQVPTVLLDANALFG
ncbi:MAG TPA: chemotaxis protein CheW [Lysobacter sp.]